MNEGERVQSYREAAQQDLGKAKQRYLAQYGYVHGSPRPWDERREVALGWALAVLDMAEWEERLTAALAEHGEDLEAVARAMGYTREDWERNVQEVEELVKLFRLGEEFRGKEGPERPLSP